MSIHQVRSDSVFSLIQTQLQHHNRPYFFHIVGRQSAELIVKASFAGSRQLVSQRFSRVTVERDERFARIKFVDVAGQRHDLNAIEITIGGVVAHDNGGASLLYFAADRGIEIDSPNFTAFHQHLQ